MKLGQLWLLRHGECEGGAILRGRTDVPLSETGWQQMHQALAQIKEQSLLPWRIFSSPLQRCAAFAESIATPDSPVTLLRQLQEVDFGHWDGRALEDLYAEQSLQLDRYWQDPWTNSPPSGESTRDFEARIDAAFAQILEQLFFDDNQTDFEDQDGKLEDPRHVSGPQVALIVTHGGVMRHLMSTALGLGQGHGLYRQLDLPHAAVVKISVYQERQGQRHFRLHWPNA